MFPTVPTYMYLYPIKRDLLTRSELDKKWDDSTYRSKLPSPIASLNIHATMSRSTKAPIYLCTVLSLVHANFCGCSRTSVNPEWGNLERRCDLSFGIPHLYPPPPLSLLGTRRTGERTGDSIQSTNCLILDLGKPYGLCRKMVERCN